MPANSPVASLTFRDYSKETSTMSINILPVTAGNAASILTDWGTLKAAIAGISLGVQAKETMDFFNTVIGAISPASNTAQRELKWSVRGYDEREFLDVGNTVSNPNHLKTFAFTIPTADLSLLSGASDILDPTVVAVGAFITEIEKLWRSPSDGQMRVIDITLAGRNL